MSAKLFLFLSGAAVRALYLQVPTVVRLWKPRSGESA
jgi:hypothetical protein